MVLGMQRRTAAIVGTIALALVLALILALVAASTSLLAVAREFTQGIQSQFETSAGRANRAEAALRQQGGSLILLKLDIDALREAIVIGLRDDVRRVLREE